MKYKLSKAAEVAFNAVVQKMQSGDLSDMIDVLDKRISLPDDAPARKWTYRNQLLAYTTSQGELDCRGYRQWQEVGRQVPRGGGITAYILGPDLYKKENEETGETEWHLYGYHSIHVFPYSRTEGEPIEAYEVPEAPPLLDVAERIGLQVRWEPLLVELGHFKPHSKEIAVGTHDVKTFFHELCHAGHQEVIGKELQGGQDLHQEAVAELGATVLMQYYGLGDRTGNCWEYIASYSDDDKDVLGNVLTASLDVAKVLAYLLGQEAPKENGHGETK